MNDSSLGIGMMVPVFRKILKGYIFFSGKLLYSEVEKEAPMSEMEKKPKTSKEAVTAIIMAGIAVVVCIMACATVSVVFILNAPW